MRASTGTPNTSRARTPVLSRGLPPEQFGATIAWLGDEPDFQIGGGPVGPPRDEGGAQEDDDMADVLDYFM